jgi:hypothetical protein
MGMVRLAKLLDRGRSAAEFSSSAYGGFLELSQMPKITPPVQRTTLRDSLLSMDRLDRYVSRMPPSRKTLQARARDLLEFCEIIIRINQQAGDLGVRQPDGLRDLMLWAHDTLQRPA